MLRHSCSSCSGEIMRCFAKTQLMLTITTKNNMRGTEIISAAVYTFSTTPRKTVLLSQDSQPVDLVDDGDRRALGTVPPEGFAAGAGRAPRTSEAAKVAEVGISGCWTITRLGSSIRV